MDDKTRLKNELVRKMREEYQQFLKNLEHKESKEIIEAAYPKCSHYMRCGCLRPIPASRCSHTRNANG